MNKLMIAAAVVMMWGHAPASAETAMRQIMVSGEGVVEAVPDMATITLGVTNEATEARDAMEATSQAVRRVLERLATIGIEPRDMQTQRFALNPVWSDRTGSASGYNRARITGFVASNMVMIRVRDLDALGGVLDAVIADGANDFNGLHLSVQQPRPLMDQARRAAVHDAMAKAALLAEAAGVTLGPVISMTEQGGSRPPRMMEAAAARSGGAPIAAGEVTISASVSMVFELSD